MFTIVCMTSAYVLVQTRLDLPHNKFCPTNIFNFEISQ